MDGSNSRSINKAFIVEVRFLYIATLCVTATMSVIDSGHLCLYTETIV